MSGTKADLLARVDHHINAPVVASADVRSFEGEFDWVVPWMGGLHQEFMICRTFVDVNWDVAYHAYALSQGYHGERQLAYVKRGKDHHKTFNDLSRYVDGIVDELMFQYCKVAEGEPTVGGFLAWIGEKKRECNHPISLPAVLPVWLWDHAVPLWHKAQCGGTVCPWLANVFTSHPLPKPLKVNIRLLN